MNEIHEIKEVLKLIKRPSRYINSEWNSIHKNHADVNVCFCFPDLYELGASNLGLEILYQIVNSRPDAAAQRCYCPDKDLEELLISRNLPLFSIETQQPLKDFDIVGFSLQYELCFTNVLTMLKCAGIPFKSIERGNSNFPLLIAGGPVCYNPEPMSDFFDLFVIGDGEEVIGEILDKIKELKAKDQRSKTEILVELAKIPGVYVPVLHKTLSDYKIEKRTVNIEKSFYPVKPIVPYMQTVHDRLNIEISRGCVHGCRFCQATNIYHPWRDRSQEKIMQLLDKGIKNTGYDELSLSSLSVSSYPEIDELIKKVNEYCLNENVSLSIPSLRCNSRSVKLFPFLIYPKRANLTFAIEAGSQRLRNVIGKEISDEDVYNTMLEAGKYGWKLVKLYFMIGLPGEQNEDIEAIINMVNKLVRLTPRINYNITISPFVPKPHSPFQWAGMENTDSLQEKKNVLTRRLKASVKGHNINMSRLEGVFARGDSKLSSALISAWEKGARFDHWHEYFRNDIWENSFIEHSIDKSHYLGPRNETDELPWSHISAGRDREYLLKEYKKSIELAKKPLEETVPAEAVIKEPQGDFARQFPWKNTDIKRQRINYRLRFGRKNKLKYLSHLEQIELVRKVIRRSELPVNYSEGFHPQMNMSFGPAITVGYESSSEFVDIELRQSIEIKSLAEKIMRQLPEDFMLIEIKQMLVSQGSIDSIVNLIEYEIRGIPEIGDTTKINNLIQENMAKSCINIDILKKGKTITLDARPLIYKFELNNNALRLFLRAGPKKNIKPEKIMEHVFNLNQEQINGISVNRKDIYLEKNDGTLERFI
ncbi:MAG: TIGR03960 family B12-binding radical SAM protein [Elusimicrobia bacterium]|nr:TIGR03960 family B12-binding radical SAM protein [Elusimicrobiota bacterium]MBU2615009.1 TIGR03960 family B12-binding radical SAM protein [Elusimicrobiota bacterium]